MGLKKLLVKENSLDKLNLQEESRIFKLNEFLMQLKFIFITIKIKAILN